MSGATKLAEQRAKNAEYNRQWREKNPGKQSEYSRRWREKNLEKARESRRIYHRRLREDVFALYGGACSCCGEATYEFLSLEHACKDGAAERRRGRTNQRVLTELRRRGEPDPRYSVLCHNCNQARGHYGACPHERVQEEATP